MAKKVVTHKGNDGVFAASVRQRNENLMRKTFEAAHQDYLLGHYKAHDQVMSEMRAKYV